MILHITITANDFHNLKFWSPNVKKSPCGEKVLECTFMFPCTKLVMFDAIVAFCDTQRYLKTMTYWNIWNRSSSWVSTSYTASFTKCCTVMEIDLHFKNTCTRDRVYSNTFWKKPCGTFAKFCVVLRTSWNTRYLLCPIGICKSTFQRRLQIFLFYFHWPSLFLQHMVFVSYSIVLFFQSVQCRSIIKHRRISFVNIFLHIINLLVLLLYQCVKILIN